MHFIFLCSSYDVLFAQNVHSLKNYIAFLPVFLFFRRFHFPNSLNRFLFTVLEHEVNVNKLIEIVVSTS